MPEIAGSTILVTGGAGTIGSHVVDALVREGAGKVIVYENFSEGERGNLEWALSQGPTVEIVRADIRDLEDLMAAMKGVDCVYHLAAVLLLESRDKPQKAVDVNIKGTLNVLQACVANQAKKLIFASAGAIFGEPLYLPVDENHPFNNVTFYGATKIAGEQMCTAFYHQYGLNFVGLRCYNVYGPRQGAGGPYAQVLPRWLDRMDQGLPLVIFGDGSQTMDLIYISDVVRAYVLALKTDVTNEFFNIGTGVETSVKELAGLLIELRDYRVPLGHEPHDVNVVQRRWSSTVKAEAMLGFKAQVPVREGLQKYLEWWDARKAARHKVRV